MSKEKRNPYEYCKEHRTISVKTPAGCPLCLQAQLATANEEAKNGRSLWKEAQSGRKKLRLELDKVNKENRWRSTDDPPGDIDYDKIVEAIEESAEIPVFVTMAEIFLDEGSEYTYWRPKSLPKGE